MNFKSYYKTKLKNSVPAPRTPVPEVKLPPPLPRSSSIKINTKAAQPPAPAPQPSQPARPVTISKPTPPADTIVAAAGVPRPLNGTSSLLKTGVKLESQSGLLAKRPRPEKGDQVSTPKRPKVEQPSSSSFDKITALPKKRRIVTLKTSNPKRLAVILGHTKTLSSIPSRTALPSAAPKEQPALGLAKDINALKPARKPLPGEIVRKPLPMGGSSSSLSSLPGSQTTSKIFAKHRPPMPGPKASSKSPSKSPSKSATPPVASQPAAAAAATSAPVPSARPKIKIIRKPQPTQASPAP